MNESTFFMAHGSGIGHKSDFLNEFSAAFCRMFDVQYVPVTLNYMQEIEKTGKKRPPPNFLTLVDEYELLLKDYSFSANKIVAGKSMGGRLATQLTNVESVSAVVCFGFPFHQQGKPEKNRLSFLENITKPCFIFQGTRDAFGRPDWVDRQTLPDLVEIQWVEGANHDFEVLKKYQKSREQVIEEMLVTMCQWLRDKNIA